MHLLLVQIPALATLLWIAIEMPRPWKAVFFRVPVFISSSAISLVIGLVGRGVMGPMCGFIAEIVLFPGLWLTKKLHDRAMRKQQK